MIEIKPGPDTKATFKLEEGGSEVLEEVEEGSEVVKSEMGCDVFRCAAQRIVSLS